MRIARISVRLLIVLVALAAIGAGALGVRASTGKARLREAMTLDAVDRAWLGALPAPDRAWCDDVRAWMKTKWPAFQAGRKREARQALHDSTWCVRGEAMPEVQQQRHEAERGHVEALTALLAVNQPCISGASWIRFARAEENGKQLIHIPNMLGVRGAANWYAREAMRSKRPADGLDNLDNLIASLQPAGSLIDALIFLATSSIRDDAYLQLALAGRIRDQRLNAWLDERASFRDAVIDAFRGERMGFWSVCSKRLGSAKFHTLWSGDASLIDHLDRQWHGHRDLAAVLDAHRTFERFCSGTADATAIAAVQKTATRGGKLREVGLPNFTALLTSMVHGNTHHRIRRVLARAARTVRTSKTRPTTQDELRTLLGTHAALLDGDPWTYAFHYSAIGTHRLRFVVRDAKVVHPELRALIQPHFTAPGKRDKHWDKEHLRIEQAAAEVLITP